MLSVRILVRSSALFFRTTDFCNSELLTRPSFKRGNGGYIEPCDVFGSWTLTIIRVPLFSDREDRFPSHFPLILLSFRKTVMGGMTSVCGHRGVVGNLHPSCTTKRMDCIHSSSLE